MPKRKAEDLAPHSTGPTKFWTPATLRYSQSLPRCSTTHVGITSSPFAKLDPHTFKLPGDKSSWFSVRKTTLTDTSKHLHGLAIPQPDPFQPVLSKPRFKKLKPESDAPRKVTAPKPPVGGAQKIRIYPTPHQREIIKKWFGGSRYVYNRVVEHINTLCESSTHIKEREVRDHFRKTLTCRSANPPGSKTAWLTDIPSAILDEAIADALKAYKSSLALVKAGHAKRFHLHPKTKKSPSDSITILKLNYTGKGCFFTSYLGKDPIASSKDDPLPDKLDYDSRLVFTCTGEFFLCIPRAFAPNVTSVDRRLQLDQGTPQRIISLDPGVRTFVTGYDLSGSLWEWGKGDMEKIYIQCKRLDKLLAKARAPIPIPLSPTQVKEQQVYDSTRNLLQLSPSPPSTNIKPIKHRTRYHILNRVQFRIQARIRNLVDELHKKLVCWLINNYDVILLPEFRSSDMVTKQGRQPRRIRSKTARSMLTWAHYRFRARLVAKAREFPHCSVILCDEVCLLG
jgi:putative transposase